MLSRGPGALPGAGGGRGQELPEAQRPGGARRGPAGPDERTRGPEPRLLGGPQVARGRVALLRRSRKDMALWSPLARSLRRPQLRAQVSLWQRTELSTARSRGQTKREAKRPDCARTRKRRGGGLGDTSESRTEVRGYRPTGSFKPQDFRAPFTPLQQLAERHLTLADTS